MLNSKLPPIPFLTLDRAAKILDCDVDDFIFWNSQGMIPLFVYLDGINAELIFTSKEKKLNTECKSFIKDITKNFGHPVFIQNYVKFFGKFTTSEIKTKFKRSENIYDYDYNLHIPDETDGVQKYRLNNFRIKLYGTAKGIWVVNRLEHWAQVYEPSSWDFHSTNDRESSFYSKNIKIKILYPAIILDDARKIFNCELMGFDNDIYDSNKLLISKESIELLLSANNKYLPDKYKEHKNADLINWFDFTEENNNIKDIGNIKNIGKPHNYYKQFAIESATLTRDKYPYSKVTQIATKIRNKIGNDFRARNPPNNKTIENWLYDVKLGKPKIKSNDDFELVIPDEWIDYSE